MSKPRILTVDDRPSITRLFRRLLEADGYAVQEENDSMHALQAVRDFKPDLVLLDVHMPEMDGCEIAKQLAADEALKTTPVVFISGGAESAVANIMRPTDFSFLPKPFEIDSLLNFVREHIAHAA